MKYLAITAILALFVGSSYELSVGTNLKLVQKKFSQLAQTTPSAIDNLVELQLQSQEQANAQLTDRVARSIWDKIKSWFKKDSKAELKFDQLPIYAQTLIRKAVIAAQEGAYADEETLVDTAVKRLVAKALA